MATNVNELIFIKRVKKVAHAQAHGGETGASFDENECANCFNKNVGYTSDRT